MALCALTTPEKSIHTPPAFLETAVILHGMCHIGQYIIIQCAIIHIFIKHFFVKLYITNHTVEFT